MRRMPVLKKLASAKSQPARSTIAEATPWLPWKQRSRLFRSAVALISSSDGAMRAVAWNMGSAENARREHRPVGPARTGRRQSPAARLLGSLYSVLSSQYQSDRDQFSDGITNRCRSHSEFRDGEGSQAAGCQGDASAADN